MRWPFFSRKKDDTLRIPLEETQQNAFAVLFHQRGELPDLDAARAATRDWLARHGSDPLREVILAYLEGEFVQVSCPTVQELPPPPVDYLRLFRLGELEERRVQEATHSAVIIALDILVHPRVGLWTAIAVSRALAEATGGVILDPEIPRVLKLETLTEPLPPDGVFNLTDHVLIPSSVDKRGLAWMTTKGMCRFGLPDLEIVDVPPNLVESLWPVMNGVAYALIARLLNRETPEEDDSGPPTELVLEPELILELGHVSASSGGERHPEIPEGAKGRTPIRLEYRRGRRDEASFLRLCAPEGFRGPQGVWLNSVLADLLGAPNTMLNVPSSSESMEAAHFRAVDELPRVKARFQAGLEPGETLHVKHGFPVRDDMNEYMWVVVNTWAGNRIRGQLMNNPRHRLDLRAGQAVELRDEDVFDWLITHLDGREEGGYTNRVAQQEGEAGL